MLGKGLIEMRRLHDTPTVPPLVLEFDRVDADQLIDQIKVLRNKADLMFLPSSSYPHLVEFFDSLGEYLDEVEGV